MPAVPGSDVLSRGQVLAEKYRVERLLGAGGMSSVYAGMHLGLEQPIALKVLKPKLAANASYVTRFVREARAAAKLTGAHVGRVLDVGTYSGGLGSEEAPFIAMELLQGEDLGSLLAKRRSFAVHEAVDYAIQACDGLARAHAVGIIHRDVKPANLFLTEVDGEPCVKVIDFGVAKQIEEEVTQLTNTSEVFGSPQYMSPEQVRASKHVDVRSDVWSLGCVLYEFLTGAPPFESPSIMTLTSLIISEPATPLRKKRADIPAALEAVVMQCLEKKPERRHASVIDLAIALEPFGRPNLNGRLVESLRRLRIGEAGPASNPRRSLEPPTSTRSFVPSSQSPSQRPKRVSPKVILITGAATFALVLLLVFVIDRALHH